MEISELERIVTPAIHNQLIVEVDYIREEDGVRTCRRMEPFDVAAGRRSTTGELKFWGWCLTHDRIEQKTPSNILSIKVTSETFEPHARERTFTSAPDYRIPRNW